MPRFQKIQPNFLEKKLYYGFVMIYSIACLCSWCDRRTISRWTISPSLVNQPSESKQLTNNMCLFLWPLLTDDPQKLMSDISVVTFRDFQTYFFSQQRATTERRINFWFHTQKGAKGWRGLPFYNRTSCLRSTHYFQMVPHRPIIQNHQAHETEIIFTVCLSTVL